MLICPNGKICLATLTNNNLLFPESDSDAPHRSALPNGKHQARVAPQPDRQDASPPEAATPSESPPTLCRAAESVRVGHILPCGKDMWVLTFRFCTLVYRRRPCLNLADFCNALTKTRSSSSVRFETSRPSCFAKNAIFQRSFSSCSRRAG